MDKVIGALDTSSWENYKKSLGKAVVTAQNLGMSDKMLTHFTKEIGNYLNINAHADLPENKVLNEMWCVADDSEKTSISQLLIKVSQNSAE